MPVYSYKNETGSSVSIGGITFDPQETKDFIDRQPVLDEHVDLTVLSRYIDSVFDETVPLSAIEQHIEDHKRMGGLQYHSATFRTTATFGLNSRYLESNDSWGFGTIAPTHQMHFVLRNNDNILIDAATNPRVFTLGVMRFEHVAGISGTRPISMAIDLNGFADTHAVVIDVKTTNLVTGSNHIYEVSVDTANSTGGAVRALAVSKTGYGAAEVTAVETYGGVAVILQKVGLLGLFTQAWVSTLGVFTDSTVAFSTASNIPLFTNDNDFIYLGNDAVFSQIEIHLQTPASNTIQAIFQYSTGLGTWMTFAPSDGSNGFSTSGCISWLPVVGWVAAAVNGVSKYYVRIQRTRNTLATLPTEASLHATEPQLYGWDKDGKVSLQTLKASGLLVYADRAAALAGGLVTGDFYKTSVGAVMIV